MSRVTRRNALFRMELNTILDEIMAEDGSLFCGSRIVRSKMKILVKLFSFLSAIIMFCFGTVTAFAADEAPPETNEKGYPVLTDEPEDGDIKWAWPLDGLYDSFRQVAYNLVMSSLDGSFKMIDGVTAEANAELKKTPLEYQATIFNTVDTVAKKVIMPIATVILTYVVLLDFMQGVMDKNSFHDFDTSIFLRLEPVHIKGNLRLFGKFCRILC